MKRHIILCILVCMTELGRTLDCACQWGPAELNTKSSLCHCGSQANDLVKGFTKNLAVGVVETTNNQNTTG